MTSPDAPNFVGILEGHGDWVTSVRTPAESDVGANRSMVISTSRDKTVMIWNYSPDGSSEKAGYALKRLTGHSQPIRDLSVSVNGKYGLTGSDDKTLRLWDFEHCVTLRRFVGHTSDVNSVALSPDNRQIISGSRDKTIKLWNTKAECKYTILEDKHDDWVSCVRFSPNESQTLIVSCGWDKLVKVWDLQKCELKTNLAGHSSLLHTVTISPDGSLCASGGKDGVAMLWDVNEGRHLYSLPANSTINALCFSPCNYWLCAATDDSIKIWNLEDKEPIAELKRPVLADKSGSAVKNRKNRSSCQPWLVSLTWSADGQTLFAGSTDGNIYVYELPKN